MKQPPYFKLTEGEPQTAIWVGLMFMIIALLLIASVGQRLSNGSNEPIPDDQTSRTQRRNLLRALQQTFAAESQQGAVSIEDNRTHIGLAINMQLLCQLHEAELSPRGERVLNRLAQALRSFPGAGYRRFQIGAHTERDGFTAANYPHDNWELTSGQAVNVLKYLVTTVRLNAKLFSAQGYADSHPLTGAPTVPAKITNRRLEVKIFTGSEKP